MKIALIGPLMSGKSTLFRAITGQPAPSHPVVGEQLAVIKVPDPRLEWVFNLFKPKKMVEAAIDCVDVPGFSHETAAQQAEFRRALPDIRQCDALVAVVRAFDNEAVPAYRNRVDPQADLAELMAELLFCDLETVTTRSERLAKSLKKPTRTHEQEKRELELMHRCQAALENEQPITTAIHTEEERKMLGGFAFLTELPLIVVINVNDKDAASPPPFAHPHAKAAIVLCADMEEQIAALEAADRQAFLADLGVKELARDRLIHACYDAVGLISFLTGGGDNEARAWAVKRGSTTLEAAAKIHSDIARGFIRAETVAFTDLKAAGDLKAARAAGKVRLEGKTYVVQDGDFITFRFNV